MGYFSFLRDERVHFVGLGLTTVVFLYTMRSILEYYRDETLVYPPEPKTQYITQDTEDALEESTLHTLLEHYNFSIRDTAVRIVTGRAVNSSTISILLRGIMHPDYEHRMKNLRALVFTVEDKENYVEHLGVLNNAQAYRSLVRCLELCLDDVDHEKLDDPLYDEYDLRDVGERRCLGLLGQLIHRYGVGGAVEANFVDKWLARQPWGDTDEERLHNFDEYIKRKKNRLSAICLDLKTSKTGRKALAASKLIIRSKKSKRDRKDKISVVLELTMNGEASIDGLQVENARAELVPRVVDQSAEEQRLRRRHREAMVLNDGTHPPGRGDIIEREHDSNS